MANAIIIVYVAVIFLWMVGIGGYYLWVGAQGLRTHHPVLMPGRRIVLLLAPFLIGTQLVSGVSSLLSRSPYSSPNYFPFIAAAFWALWAVILWYQNNGYLVLGASQDAMRDSLHGALEQLNLPYEENLAKIHLSSLDADLQVSVASWAGVIQLRVKQAKQSAILSQIIPVLRQKLEMQTAPLVKRPLYLYLAIGVMIVVIVPALVMLIFMPMLA